MSTIVLPRPPGAARSGHPDDVGTAGKLATTVLSVTVAGAAEPARFRRGRAYASTGAVVRLTLDPGIMRAEVQGSDPTPYDVEVRCPTVGRPHDAGSIPERRHVTAVLPDGDDLSCWCTCPDADRFCKHVVAALTGLAQEFTWRPELVFTWCCADGAPARRVAGEQARRDRHLRAVPDLPGPPGQRRLPPPSPSPFDGEPWRAFVGADLPPPGGWIELLADAPAPTVASVHVDHIDVGAIVRSMTRAVADAFRRDTP